MNKKKNAIIMAAGLSTRFVPLSLEIPKALLVVKGEVLIERQIRQLREAGIEEIIVVVGYLKEKFKYLEETYGVILVENPVYKERNNHSTLYVASKYLGDTFICSGDNYFTENVFAEETKHSYYASVFEKGQTNEWCMLTDEIGKINQVTIGGNDMWVMKGHAYWTKEFSEFMIPYIEHAYHTDEKKNQFWEDIFIEHIEEVEMYIQKYESGIIEEFDSIEELREFDERYNNTSGSKIMQWICAELECKEQEVKSIKPRKKNGEVTGFSFVHKETEYTYELEEARLY